MQIYNNQAPKYRIMQSQGQVNCSNCSIKDQFIQNCQEEIQKFKRIISDMKNNEKKSTQNSSMANISSQFNFNKTILPISIKMLFHNRQFRIFQNLKSLSSPKKLPLLIFQKYYSKVCLELAFTKIVQFSNSKRQYNLSITTKNQHVNNALQEEGINIQESVSLTQANSFMNNYLKKMMKSSNPNLTRILRDFIMSQQKCKMYQLEIQKLKEQLEETHRVLSRQNEKKKTSIEMFAQDLAEKNQIIQQLQEALQKYQTQTPVNLLKQQIIELRNQKQNLCKELSKSQEDNSSLQEKIRATQQQCSQYNKQLDSLYQQIQTFKQKCQQYQSQSYHFQSSKKQMENYISELLRKQSYVTKRQAYIKNKSHKLNNLKKKIIHDENYGKQFADLLRNALSGEKENCEEIDQIQPDLTLQISKLQNKVAALLGYISNLFVPNFNILYQQFFSGQEIKMLEQTKEQVIRTNYSLYIASKNQSSLQNNNKYRFDAQEACQSLHYDECRTERYPRIGLQFIDTQSKFKCLDRSIQPNATIQLLQMQISRNKQIEKISQLKNQMLHLRDLVLSLLKTLDLAKTKPQTKEMLNVLFNIFQYSEIEKSQIFNSSKKRFFGLV